MIAKTMSDAERVTYWQNEYAGLQHEHRESRQLIHRLTKALEGLVNADAGGETTPDFERAIQTAREALAAAGKTQG